jgi:hypothetical protein
MRELFPFLGDYPRNAVLGGQFLGAMEEGSDLVDAEDCVDLETLYTLKQLNCASVVLLLLELESGFPELCVPSFRSDMLEEYLFILPADDLHYFFIEAVLL